jgi:CRP-like cAMP-binding protein
VSIHQLRSHFAAGRVEPRPASRPTSQPPIDQPVVTSWDDECTGQSTLDLPSALMPSAKHQPMPARSTLFADGSPANDYYFLAAGRLLVHRDCEAGVPDARAVVQFVTAGDLFAFDCDGRHFANCTAIADSLLLRIPRLDLEILAARDEKVNRVLKAVHANELAFVLRSLGGPVSATD